MKCSGISDARLLDLPLAKGGRIFARKKATANPEELLERELAEYTQKAPELDRSKLYRFNHASLDRVGPEDREGSRNPPHPMCA